MAAYNGHPSWTAWSVSLWINNDEGLYNLALDCVRGTTNRRDAAALMLEALAEHAGCDCPKTPDGARYSLRTIQGAMRGMER